MVEAPVTSGAFQTGRAGGSAPDGIVSAQEQSSAGTDGATSWPAWVCTSVSVTVTDARHESTGTKTHSVGQVEERRLAMQSLQESHEADEPVPVFGVAAEPTMASPKCERRPIGQTCRAD